MPTGCSSISHQGIFHQKTHNRSSSFPRQSWDDELHHFPYYRCIKRPLNTVACGSPILHKTAPYLRGSQLKEKQRWATKTNAQCHWAHWWQQCRKSLVHLNSSSSDMIQVYDQTHWIKPLYWFLLPYVCFVGWQNFSKFQWGKQGRSLSWSYIDLDFCPPGTKENSQRAMSRNHIPQIINCEIKKRKLRRKRR